MRCAFSILFLAALLASCSDPDAPVRQTLQNYLAEGRNRPFGAGGPRFAMPPGCYQYFREHPQLAMEELETQLASEDSMARCNAYDFITQLAPVESARPWALEKMKYVLDHEGLASINTVRAAYAKWTASQNQPETHPQ